MPPRRALTLGLLALAGAMVALFGAGGGAAPAAIAPLGEQVTLETPGTTAVPCQDGLALARNAVWTYAATRPEALTVLSDAPAGTDYDLAVYDRETGDALASSSSFTSAERVTVLLRPGQTADVQACRRTGGAEQVELTLRPQALPADALAPGFAPQLVEVALPAGAADASRLTGLGLDITHAVDEDSAQVILYSASERARLTDAGFGVTTIDPDLPASLRRMTRADERREPGTRALPSGRTTYRAFGDYGTDLKAIADTYPGHVKATTLAGTTLEGRPFEGVEIASDVGKPDDGRPILLITGLTHAREWPGGEMAIEFAIDLAKTYAAGTDTRVNDLLRKTRVFVFPMANPDGFSVSRTAGTATGNDAGDDSPDLVTLPFALNDSGAYKRKNCRAATPAEQATPCAGRVGLGVDLNRAYSAYWGGAGSSDTMTGQDYRGTAPFTEPEAQALRVFAQQHQTQVYITNHTNTPEGRILRQPGFDIPGDEVEPTTPDELRMKALGDAMAASTQGISELGYATLGNITGPADDFFYYSQGTYGYTPELRGANFHTGYATAVIKEYEGFDATAGRGWREAYIVAGEFAADPADHVVLTGTAPTDATLRLRKDFTLPQSTDTDGDGTDDVALVENPEKIDTTLAVGSDGAFEWHVNPSKRPYGPAGEAITLTCERAGAVVATRTFTAARGDTKTFAFSDCGAAAGATATPTSTATPTGTATVTPTPGPSVTPRLRVGLRRPAFSARRVNRRKRIGIRVVLRGSGSLRSVTIRVVDRKGRTVLRGTRRAINGKQRVRVRRVRRLKAGRHRIVLTARTDSGAAVRKSRSLKIKR